MLKKCNSFQEMCNTSKEITLYNMYIEYITDI